MHDIDRTLTEVESGMEEFTSGEFEYDEAETYDGPGVGEVFDEAEEMELAAELLGVTDEAEIDQFLGKLLKSAGRNVGRILNSPTTRRVGGMLKNVARQALPTVGSVLGGLAATGIGAAAGVPIPPQVGSAIGGQLASAAGSMFGLELEGLSPEDQEFEVARRFVRFAGNAVKHAASALPNANPQTVARAALTAAARQHAPGLLHKSPLQPLI
jgi:phage tail tape-measure protein